MAILKTYLLLSRYCHTIVIRYINCYLYLHIQIIVCIFVSYKTAIVPQHFKTLKHGKLEKRCFKRAIYKWSRYARIS